MPHAPGHIPLFGKKKGDDGQFGAIATLGQSKPKFQPFAGLFGGGQQQQDQGPQVPALPGSFQGQDFFNQLFGAQAGSQGLPGFVGAPQFLTTPLAGTAAAPLQAAAQIGIPTGLATLLEILQSQGATDKGLLNQQLVDIQRGTASQQQDIQGQLARLGLGGSGIGQALSAATGLAGQEQRAGLLAQEAAAQEERKRQDLALLQQLLFGNILDFFGIQQGVPPRPDQPSDFEKLLGAGATFFGGPGGAQVISKLCWVARAVYGENDPRWLLARHFITTMAPNEFRQLYARGGELAAEAVKQDPELKARLRPVFDTFVDMAVADLSGVENG